MLQAKTEEQRNRIEEIANKHLHSTHCEYCDYTYGNVYRNCNEVIEINIKCQDCKNELCIDIPFDMMAEIIDYLRSVNKPKKSERFVKPTIEEIQAHILEKGYTFDAEAFYAFYESNGWKVGKNPMKNWKMACTTWEKNRKSNYNNNANYGRETITEKIRRSVEESNIFSQQLAERIGSQQQADVCDGDNDEVW